MQGIIPEAVSVHHLTTSHTEVAIVSIVFLTSENGSENKEYPVDRFDCCLGCSGYSLL